MNETGFYKSCLSQELARRCERNPRYSIRSYSRALGVDVATLSRILAGKQVPSARVAQKIFKALDLTPHEQARFMASLADAHRARGLQRISPVFKNGAQSSALESGESAAHAKELSLELWRVIADWHHGAILELTYVEGFQSNPRWIARELGITEVEAKLAIERLLQLGLLEMRRGRLRKTHESLTTADKALTTSAHRRLQKQVLEASLQSLENDPIEERSHTSMTMTIDPARIVEAKKMISEFNHKLCAFLEGGERKRVYQLGVGLYPIQKKEKADEKR